MEAFGLALGYNESFPDGTFMHASLTRDGQKVFAVSKSRNDALPGAMTARGQRGRHMISLRFRHKTPSRLRTDGRGGRSGRRHRARHPAAGRGFGMGGIGYRICCTVCGYKKRMMGGIGMVPCPENAGDREYALALLSSQIRDEKKREHVLALVRERYARLEGEYGRYPYRCPACGEFYILFDFRLAWSGGDYRPSHRCFRCGAALEQIDLHSDVNGQTDPPPVLPGFPCPRCKSKTLCISPYFNILWD